MNYRHIYHAGSFADVFKHIVLIALTQALLRKEKPFCYLDTHAGIARYDLFAQEAKKTQEAQNGIFKLSSEKKIPKLVAEYLQIITAFNQGNAQLQFYPGSPRIVRSLLRSTDRMILTELHPRDFEKLKQEFLPDRQVLTQQQDAYQALKAFLPPKERRGLALIDPPFEKMDEFKQIITGIKNALERWETGIYTIWYPLKDKIEVEKFYRALKNLNKNTLIAELNIYPKDAMVGLPGCGMAIINPPYQLDETLKELVPWLWSMLAIDKSGGHKVYWLNKMD